MAQLSKIKVHKIARWVMDQYEQEGRITSISDEELTDQVKIHLPDYYSRLGESNSSATESVTV